MGYGTVARVFHWLTVLVVLIMVPVGLIMIQEGLPRPTQNALFILHKGLGPLVLVLVLARLAWRIGNPPPPLPSDLPLVQRRVAGLVQAGLYLALIVMAVSGYVRVAAGGFPLELLEWLGIPPLVPENEAVSNFAKAVHFNVLIVLIALIIAHVAGAFYHGAIRRDGVVHRMWPPISARKQ